MTLSVTWFTTLTMTVSSSLAYRVGPGNLPFTTMMGLLEHSFVVFFLTTCTEEEDEDITWLSQQAGAGLGELGYAQEPPTKKYIILTLKFSILTPPKLHFCSTTIKKWVLCKMRWWITYGELIVSDFGVDTWRWGEDCQQRQSKSDASFSHIFWFPLLAVKSLFGIESNQQGDGNVIRGAKHASF